MASLGHRGPDDGGTWKGDGGRVTLFQRRLSIIDTSSHGHQPMVSPSSRHVIVYNGELYNHRHLRGDLARRSVAFRGHSDTETLLLALEEWGVDETLRRSNGMFAFALWDERNHELTVARDRLGEKPLYWHNDGSSFSFASELRGLRAMGDITLDIDPVGATRLLRWSFIPHPGTIYRNVYQLEPGHLLKVRLDGDRVSVEKRCWWSLSDTIASNMSQQRPTTLAAAAEELKPLLLDAVASRLESDVPLGAFLSGGIDSSLVASLMRATNPSGPLRTFTVKMPDLGFDESQTAAQVAAHLGTLHTEVELSLSDVFDSIPTLATAWDEPFADPSMLPSLLLCRAARRELTVCLAGDGGDELFAGYNRHALGQSMWSKASRLPRMVRSGLASAMLAPSPGTVDRVAASAGRLLPAHRRLPNVGDKLQKAAAVMRADRNGLWETLAQIWPPSSLASPELTRPDVPVVPGMSPVEAMMLADTAVVLPDQMLVKVDRASMASSLEVRVPFLDHRLLEWSWRQPLDVKTQGGIGKLVLRELIKEYVPASIVNRPKMGFDPPLAAWLRGPLKEWAGDMVSGSRAVSNGWLDGSALETTWSEHQSGRRNFDYRLWGVLMLESWLREQHPTRGSTFGAERPE